METTNRNNCNCTGNRNDNYIISGNSIDINRVDTDIAEIRADVLLEASLCDKDANVVRLWGQVKDCQQSPIPNALLKLIKVIYTHCGEEYEGIAHTTSDCNGFYQFDLCYRNGDEVYKVLVNKAYLGIEQVIDTAGGNCDACMGNGYEYSPCREYPPIVTQQEQSNNCFGHKPGSCGCEKPSKPEYNSKPTCGCEKPSKPEYNHKQTCGYEKPTKPEYNHKPTCGSNYTQSINMPLYGCK